MIQSVRQQSIKSDKKNTISADSTLTYGNAGISKRQYNFHRLNLTSLQTVCCLNKTEVYDENTDDMYMAYRWYLDDEMDDKTQICPGQPCH